MDPTPQAAAEMLATVRKITRRVQGVRGARERLNAWWDGLWAEEKRRRRILRVAGVVGAAAVVVGGIGAYFVLRPYPQPDYATASLDEVFNFTLLKDEFNRLPIDKRLELLGMLRARIEKMSAAESALLAAFAAGIGGQAREQLEENVARLMVDLWGQHAAGYGKVAEEDRAGYLDDTLVSLVRAMEAVGGQESGMSDAEMVAQVKRDAQRDARALQEGRGPGARELSRVFAIMNNNVGGHASPAERARGQVLMRDMMRHLRGEDVRAGKDKK